MTRTIGPGWSDEPAERARQISEQEALVSKLAAIEELVPEWELEAATCKNRGGACRADGGCLRCGADAGEACR
jgi:hypothetical protein